MTITYTSLDGTEFDSEKACKEHDALPYVFIASNTYGMNSRVFLDESIAKNFCEQKNEIFGSYTIERVVINIDIQVKSIQSSITNETKEPHWLVGLIQKFKN